jgi:4-diphosphocytidyl-2-C-methyl-D-erythritol kinase
MTRPPLPVRVEAPAKLNLGLRISGLRADGFHEIRSLFRTVSLCDELRVRTEPGSGEVSVIVEEGDAPTDGSNLACAAASSWIAATGAEIDVSIRLRKRIPTAAGLGGGSSDAAAVLRVLEGSGTGRCGDLPGLALGLGSDVPFFLTGGSALVEGRGEIVRPAACPPFRAVLLVPPVSVSTPWAYSLWDSGRSSLTGTAPGRHLPASVTAWHEGKPFPIDLWNDFLPLLRENLPEVREVADALEESCVDWGLSGSGPTFFVLFRTEGEAEAFAADPPCRARVFACGSTSCDGA